MTEGTMTSIRTTITNKEIESDIAIMALDALQRTL